MVFSNVSSRLETRRWGKRLILSQNVSLLLSGTNQVTMDSGYVHSHPNLLQHCHKMINASNDLGVSFSHSHKVNTLLYRRQNMAVCELGDNPHPEYDVHDAQTNSYQQSPTAKNS